MKTKAIVIKCDKCGATDILRKVGDGPSQTTDVEGYENRRPGWVSVMRYSDSIAANYLMFEFMYPQVSGAYFKATDSKDSAGVAGKPIGSLHEHFL